MSAGMIGLATNLNKRNSAREDKNTMLTLLNLKERETQKEQMAEAQYAQQMAAVSQHASTLLENDRLQVNAKAVEFRKEIKESLKAHGGSYAKFMQSGGITQLRDYQRKITESEEFKTFQDNKVNMEKLIQAKDAGMGHLIPEQDLKAMRSYQKNGKGKISYNGLLNEIEIDPNAFEWGYEVTPEDVLATGNNKQMLIANFEADTGEVYNPSLHEEGLKQYIALKGYGGVGTNQQMQLKRIQAEATAAKKKAQEAKTTAAGTITEVAGSLGAMSYDNMSFENGYGATEALAFLGAKENKTISHVPNTDARLMPDFLVAGGWKSGQGYRLKGSASTDISSRELATEVFGKTMEPNKDGTWSVDPRSLDRVFKADGTKLDQSASWWENWKTRKYSPKGTYMVYKSADNNGDDILVTEAVDKDGKVDQAKNAELYGDQADVKGNASMVMHMTDPENPGNDFYYEIPIASVHSSVALANMLDENNDYTDAVKEQVQTAGKKEALRQAQNQKVVKMKQGAVKQAEKMHKATAESPVFQSTLFDMIKNQYQTDNGNRDALVQSFYQTVSHGDPERLQPSMESKILQHSLDQYGLTEAMMDESLTDKDIMKQLFEQDSQGTPEDFDKAYIYFEIWNSIHDKLLTK